jgi:hypothetical protein
MDKFEIYLAEVLFVENGLSKIRPILVLGKNPDGTLAGYKITSKFREKSNFIKNFYYHINDLKDAGLNLESYIDTFSIIDINLEQIQKGPLGKLSQYDQAGLAKFLRDTRGIRRRSI